MVKLTIKIDYISSVLQYYDRVQIFRSDTEGGVYSEITDEDTRIVIDPAQTIYFYNDDNGDSTKWYKTKYYNSVTTDASEFSSAMQGQVEGEKVGYVFKNYRPPTGEWGTALTADDIRFHFLWGVDLIANNDEKVEVADTQLEFAIESAVEEFEHFFNIDIRKRVYKAKPVGLTRAVEWREGVDYTNEDEPYDFDPDMWSNYGFLQLRHRPILSVESATLQSPYQTDVLDLTDWVSIYKMPGQLTFYPKGSTVYGMGYAGSGILAAWPGMMNRKYPQGYKIDYTTGFETSDFIPKDLRNAIGLLATINVLNWVGDGLMAGFSSSSVSLDGLSESFSSTQSATSAFFGARIKAYTDQLKEFVKNNKNKYGNIPLRFA